MIVAKDTRIITSLQNDILRLQGYKHLSCSGVEMQLGGIAESFPNKTFPLGTVHEFLTGTPEDVAATCGFLNGMLKFILGKKGVALWVTSSGAIFPSALQNFGVHPHHIIFLNVRQQKDALWAIDEALKCGALAAVVGEVRELDFITSRRLQLAVEESNATGFILRSNIRSLHTTVCAARWKITALPSEPIADLPGIGYPVWNVELLRVRNGKPGRWEVQWREGKFYHPSEQAFRDRPIITEKKTG